MLAKTWGQIYNKEMKERASFGLDCVKLLFLRSISVDSNRKVYHYNN